MPLGGADETGLGPRRGERYAKTGQPFEPSLPPFLEPDFREPALDRFVDEVLLDAAAARFVEPEPFLAVDLVPADFAPPRAEEADFLDPDDRVPDLEAVFEPPFDEDLEVDLEAPFEAPFEAAFEAAFEEDFEEDFAALFLAPPLFADDFAAPLEVPPADFFAALFFEDEAPLFAEDFVPFLEPDDELLEPPLFAGLEVVEPPEEPVVFV